MLHNTTTLSFTDGSAVDKAAILAENGGDVPSTGSKRTCIVLLRAKGEESTPQLPFKPIRREEVCNCYRLCATHQQLKLIRAIEGASLHVFLRAFTYRLPGVRPVWWWWRIEQWNETF